MNQKIVDYFKERYMLFVGMRDNPVNSLECPDSILDELKNLEIYFKEATGKDIKDL